jgi:two-component system CheB/CheR fusion protein
VYPASISEQVSPERLERFFAIDTETGGYRVRKSVRDVLIFF